jgi:hypothetical protein
VFGLANIATGSLPSAVGREGFIVYDATTNTVKFSDGSSWANVASAAGVDTLAAIGAVPNANGASISGTTLTLQPANATYGGVLTTGTQSIAGAKTFINSFAVTTGAVNTMSVDTSTGQVLIGDLTNVGPNGVSGVMLDVYNHAGATGSYIDVRNSGITTGSKSGIRFQSDAYSRSSASAVIESVFASGFTDSYLTFSTAGGSLTEWMRITNAGVAIGTTSLTSGSVFSVSGIADFSNIVGVGKIATGSLPAPAAGNEGFIVYDSTTNTVKYSDGSAWANISAASGVDTLGAIGAVPNANGASISGTTLTLQPADATYGGVLTAGAQTIAGAKTFSGAISASNLSGTNTDDVTLGAFGVAPDAKGLTISGQVLTLQPADGTHPGAVSTTTQTFAGDKTFSGAISASNLSGSNTGDQSLTGDVTGSGSGAISTTIANNAVSLGKMATMATASFLGRTTGGVGNVEVLSAAQSTAILDAMVGDSGAGGTKGLVPAPTTGDATKYLKGDGTWTTVTATIAIGDTVTSATAGSILFAATGPILAQDNAKLFWDNTNDRLGVGTASPSQDLHITKATTPAIQITNQDNSAGATSSILFETNGTYGVGAKIKAIMTGGFGDNSLTFETNTNSGAFVEGIRINQSGNVGIKNTSPSQALDVTGSVRFSGALMPNNTAGTSGQVLTSAGAGVVPTWTTISGMAIGGSVTSGTAGSVYFGGTAGALNQDNSNFFWDDSNNRLGINTSASPQNALDVRSSASAAVVRCQNTSTTGYSTYDCIDSAGTTKAGFGYGNSGVGAPFTSSTYIHSAAPLIFTAYDGATVYTAGSMSHLTGALTWNGLTASAPADGQVIALNVTPTFTKNNTNTRQLYVSQVKPVFNFGGSNTNTTVDIFAIDSTNTAVTGLTANLINAKYGGSARFSVSSAGNTAIAGNLTVDTNVLYADATNNTVGINQTPSTITAFSVTGTALVAQATGSIGGLNVVNTLTSNSNIGAAVYDIAKIIPTINFGASNALKTVNVLHIDTVNTATTGLTACNLISADYGGANKFLVDSAGVVTTASTITVGSSLVQSGGGAAMEVKGWASDSGSAIGAKFGTGNAFSTAGAVLMEIHNAGTRKATVSKDGAYNPDFTDDSGTTGSRTVNKPAGKNAFAAAATTITITNSCVTADSIILPVLQTNDTTAKSVIAVPTAGSFDLILNAAATGTTVVGWVVFNGA